MVQMKIRLVIYSGLCYQSQFEAWLRTRNGGDIVTTGMVHIDDIILYMQPHSQQSIGTALPRSIHRKFKVLAQKPLRTEFVSSTPYFGRLNHPDVIHHG